MKVKVLLKVFYLLLFVLFLKQEVVACTQPPTPSISTSGQLTFCDGQSVTLTASSGTDYVYQWKKNGFVISGATNQTYIATTTGRYTVVVTVDTCSNVSLPADITVNPLPNGTLTSDLSICQGTSTTLTAGGGTTYNWSAPGANGNQLMISPSSTTTYSVTITNSFGCNEVKSVQVTVKPLPIANISAQGSTTLCNGQTVVLNSSTGAGYTYQWCINSQPIPGATSQSYTASTPGNYQVITMLNGCSRESFPTTVTVNPLPTPVVSVDTTICSGVSVTMQASGGTSYQWSSGGPATANYMVSPTSTKTYTVTVTNSFGCSASASTTITVIALPNANISLSGSLTLCSGESVTLNASAGAGYSHQWYKNMAVLTGETTSMLTANSAGDYYVIVTQNGCSKTSATQTIVVNLLPVPQASNDTTICEEASVALHASGGTTYQWSSGGPATSTYLVMPTSTKTYTVTVTNAFGCSASENVVVTVIPLPQAWLSAAGSTTLCQGDILNLNTANTAGYIHEWYRNGNIIPGASSNVYSASQAGDYHVKNTANGCSAISDTISISVNPLPITGISDDVTICSGDTVTLTASGGTFYNWNTGPTTATISVSTTSARTYSVTITDGNSCSVLESVTVTTIALPNASVSLSGPTTFCADRSLTMTASSGAGYTYQWLNDATPIAAATNSALTVTQSGLYSVEVTANGCSKKSGPSNVIVNPLPIASSSPDVTICSGDTVLISAFGGTSYQWFNGSANSFLQVSPTNTTSYSVTVSNNYGCTASESVTVNTIARPSAVSNPVGSVSICSGESTTLTASTGAGYSYQWMEGNSTLNGQTNLTLTVSTSGNYHVVVTANGCPKNSNNTQVIVNPLPVVSTSNDTTVCGGSPVTLTANGGAIYKWSTGSTNQSISVAPSASTTYHVTVTSAQNCSSTGDVFVSVIPSPGANVTSTGSLTICSGDSLTLFASTGTGYSYQWKNNGSDLLGEINSSLLVTQAGSYSVVVSALGCSKISSIQNVSVNPLPTAVVSNDTTICQGNSTDVSASGGISYRWSNGRTTSVNNVSPNQTSIYQVTVTDANGCTDANSVTVNVIPLPNAFVTTSSSTNLCTGQTVTLNASSGAGYSYQWFRDGNSIAGEINTSYIASQSGSYTVRTTANGCSKTSLPSVVTVNTFLVASISDDTTICAGDTVSIFATGGGFYNWNSGETTSSITVAPATTKTYSVTVSNGVNCSAVKSTVVTVKPLPNAFILVSGGVSSICAGEAVTMNANTGAGLSYKWYKDSVEITGAVSNQYLASEAGIYTVSVTLNGCSKISSEKTLFINPLPVVSVSNDTTVCTGSPVTMIVSGGTSYVWSTFATDSVYTINPTSARTYFVTVTNSFGCEIIDSVRVNTLPLPTNVNITTSSSTQICDGSSVELRAGSTNGTEFQWQVDGTNIPGAMANTYSATKEGNYSLVVTGNGCSKTSSSLYVTVKPTPSTPDIVKIGTDTLASDVEGDNYKWFRDGITFNVGSRKVRVNKSGAYKVVVYENSCPSDTSESYYFYFTGIESDNGSALTIYPNPNNGKFEILLEKMNGTSLALAVLNVLGEKVYALNPPANHSSKLSIDISELEAGVYFLQIESAGQIFVNRVVVSR